MAVILHNSITVAIVVFSMHPQAILLAMTTTRKSICGCPLLSCLGMGCCFAAVRATRALLWTLLPAIYWQRRFLTIWEPCLFQAGSSVLLLKCCKWGYLVFYRKELEPRVLQWQWNYGCYFLIFFNYHGEQWAKSWILNTINFLPVIPWRNILFSFWGIWDNLHYIL